MHRKHKMTTANNHLSLSQSDLLQFANRGLLLHRWKFAPRYVDELLEHLPRLSIGRSETVAMESDGETARAFHGGQTDNHTFEQLTRLSVLLEAAQQILRDRAYVYQFKVNLKSAFAGDAWPWHQDYSFWANEDGMPISRALTAAVFLDEVSEFNGPMYFIPCSHRAQLPNGRTAPTVAEPPVTWQRHVGSTDLSYQTDRNKVTELAAVHGLVAAKGPRGTILFFDSKIVHASPANVSPMSRRILFITYNSITNRPTTLRRPAFLVNRDMRTLDVVEPHPEIIEPASDFLE